MERQHPGNTTIFTSEGETVAAFANPLAGSIRLRANARSRTPVRAVYDEHGCRASLKEHYDSEL